jgi:serine/threonine protein kinase
VVELPDEMKHVFNIKSSDLEIIHKIGEGSYGAVYLGRFHRQYVAIKRLTGGMISANVNEVRKNEKKKKKRK